MRRRNLAAVLVVLLCLAAAPRPAPADDDQSPAFLDTGYRDLYDLHFQQAHRAFQEWEDLHPQDPLGPVSDAAVYLFSEFDRLHVLELEFFAKGRTFHNPIRFPPDPKAKEKFEARLARAKKLIGAALALDPQNGDALFADVLRCVLRSDYITLIERRNLAGLSYLKQAGSLAEQLLAAHPDWYDAYLAIGVENYLLSLKPALVRWLLRLDGAETSRRKGLESLRLTADKGHYLLPYARFLLAVAAVHSNQPARARKLLRGLARDFPDNHVYAEELERLRRGPDLRRADLK